ncbi:GCFC-domain-containing protein [Epithele typhae]|uniref:GCFC-domain-containing protein n=1 Tax=Epithele typhae TaxID=378194 RepID=UPI002007EB36|nr:GCFC-domain-containing protein [Epithele typhae]KAH9924304.1 GCFC-domain-containing protein [Epithele typhae]
MSNAPVVFKRKGKATQRARVSTPEAEATVVDGGDAEVSESPSALAAKVKRKTRTKAKSALSFGGDEEEAGETFKLKKGVLSSNLAKGKASTGVSSSSFTPQQTSGPTYDAAYLNELKASTPSARPSLHSSALDTDVSMDVDDPSQFSAITVETPLLNPCADEQSETAIPSASSILSAKQKRERLRANKGSEDYISLSLAKQDDFSRGPHPESRLMREDDELGDADDEFAEYTSAQERIALGKKSRKKEAQKRRVEMNDMIVDAEEEDEETKEWEQEQLRRGGLRAESVEPAPKPVYKPAPIPMATPIPTMPGAMARLTKSMSELTTSHAEHSATMAKLGEEQRILDQREKEMREMIAKAEDKRSWFDAFREWIESMATFLDEKFPPLEKLEEEHINILKERAGIIAQRRKAEDEDDLVTFLGVPTSLAPAEDVVDELGRSLPSTTSPAARQSRLQARQARRTLRRATNTKQAASDEEGYSTDATLPAGDNEDYRTAMGRLVADGAALMADVKAEGFRNPAAGLGKWFGEWRAKFADVYTGAWGGLAMIGAWEFWVRLEMLGWNPLERPRSLDSFSWYGALYTYSRPSPDDAGVDEEDDEPPLGPDGDLVSAMLTTAALPRLAALITAGALDAHSAVALRRLLDLLDELSLSVPSDHPKLELLLKATNAIYVDAVTHTEDVLKPFIEVLRVGQVQARFDPAAVPARQRVLMRQRKLLAGLLRWRKAAGDRFGAGALVTRLVQDSMLPIAETGWEVGGEDVMRKVAQSLPMDLCPPSLQSLR